MVVRNDSINIKFIDDEDELDFLNDKKFKIYEEVIESIWILDELSTRTSNFCMLIDENQKKRIINSIEEIMPVLKIYCEDEDLTLKDICKVALKKIEEIFPDLYQKTQ